ncbi:lambda exonuclease family protein [Sphingomonas sp. URHD0057]|uniref:lambda exonuclease family protein n=1 Tax=Sphingomonas sp. URHD0057 TaxID=1380389 RepID=UPI00048E5AC7|nr:lambda exonuclease family protein [Sphingomonas sp. URHD0057]
MNAPAKIGVQIHCDFDQGSDRWLQARCGMLTASEFDRILTPTLKIADNVKARSHLWEMAAQRISRYVEPQYISDAMLRGQEDEIKARAEYSKRYGEVDVCGFVTNNRWGFTLGCSPDGLVGDDGMIEVKSRCQKYQVETICANAMPDDYLLQVQGELLVTQRKWCDFISYSGGLPMIVIRVFPDEAVQSAIVDAAAKFESRINEVVAEYAATMASDARLTPTERTIEEEMII